LGNDFHSLGCQPGSRKYNRSKELHN